MTLYLEKPWFEILVNEDVESVQLERVFDDADLVSLQRYRQHDYVDDPRPYRRVIDADLVEVVAQLRQRPLASRSDALLFLGVRRTVFVDRRVRQMREAVIKVIEVVFLCREPRQSLLVHIDGERMEARNQHVQPQIELVTRYQERIRYVLLDHGAAVVLQLRQIAEYKDPAAARQINGLADPVERLILVLLLQTSVVCDELGVVVREIERHGAEVEDRRSIDGLHAAKITTQTVFTRYQHRLGTVIQPLPALDVIVLGDAELRAAPPQVPVVHRLFQFVVF